MDAKELKELAQLCYVDLNEEEQSEFSKQLMEIFSHIENTLKNIDPEKIPHQRISLDKLEIFNDDMPQCDFKREEMLLNARREKNGFVLVPKIIKGGR